MFSVKSDNIFGRNSCVFMCIEEAKKYFGVWGNFFINVGNYMRGVLGLFQSPFLSFSLVVISFP